MCLEKFRSQIDKIDSEIVKLLNQRAELALRISELKAKEQLPVFDSEREQKIFEKLCSENSGPLSNESIMKIYLSIIQESRALQAKNILRQSEG